MTVVVKFVNLTNNEGSPNKPCIATSGAVGFDLSAAIDDAITLAPMQRVCVGTGIAVHIPDGYAGFVHPRSGIALKYGVTVLNSPGVIDNDYRGEIKVILINMGSDDFIVKHNMRIAQLVFLRTDTVILEQVQHLATSIRNDDGFGSTGL